MPTTSNFGWTTPADTDLVKNGALAIRTLGNGIDTSMAELKGGTTGQVLSKSSNTDMDFTWVTTDDANAIQNAIVDAKGDLIAASAADTPARLAVGNNGETLVADSSATTGLRWQGTQAAGRNIVINGGMDIWQRSTSISLSASSGATYTADRWQVATGANQASVVSRQTISDSTNLPFIQYAMRVQRNSGQTGTATTFLASSFESANSIIMANRTVTLSFYARAGANYSPSSSSLPVNLVSGTGNDQNVFSGLTGQANIVSQTATLTTTWQRFTYSGNVANTTTQLALYFSFNPTGTAGANDWFEITGIQVEVGSVATQFTRAGGTLAGEYAACCRYYQRNVLTSNGFNSFGQGLGSNTSSAAIQIQMMGAMRTTPTTIDFANIAVCDDTTRTAVTTCTISTAYSQPNLVTVNAGVAGTPLTQYRPYFLQQNNNTAGYLGIGAEL